MNVKEKTKQLVDDMYIIIEDATAGMFEEDVPYVEARYEAAKQCALKQIDVILDSNNNFINTHAQYNYWIQIQKRN